MPTVESKTGKVDLTVSAELLKQTNHITADEIDAVVFACNDYSLKSKLAKKAEEHRNKLLAGIFQKSLGIMATDEIKRMDSGQVAKLVMERIANGLFTFEKEFNFKQTSARRAPNYQDHLIKAVGQAKVIEIQENEPLSYSYIIVAA